MFCIRQQMLMATGLTQKNTFTKSKIHSFNIFSRARCGFTLTIKRERLPPVRTETQHPLSVLQVPPPNLGPPQQPGQPKSPWPQCQQVPDVPNGRMVCLSQQDRLKCTPVCDQQHVFYQKFSSRPPTYICSEHRSLESCHYQVGRCCFYCAGLTGRSPSLFLTAVQWRSHV